MADPVISVFEGADTLTGHCTAAVRAGRFVRVSATADMYGVNNPQIAEAVAGGHGVIGVARTDGVINEEIPLFNANQCPPLVAGAVDIVAGNELTSDATGRAVPVGAGDAVLAIALEDQATTDGRVVSRLKV